MPSYTDFNSTRDFRDKILARTLQRPNGPQTFTNTNYIVQNLSDLPDTYSGEVDQNRKKDLSVPQTTNIFKPKEYFIFDNIEVLFIDLSMTSSPAARPTILPAPMAKTAPCGHGDAGRGFRCGRCHP